jgi:hypothetical protein
LTRSRIDPGDKARDQNLCPEPPCLLERTTREFIARDSTGEP